MRGINPAGSPPTRVPESLRPAPHTTRQPPSKAPRAAWSPVLFWVGARIDPPRPAFSSPPPLRWCRIVPPSGPLVPPPRPPPLVLARSPHGSSPKNPNVAQAARGALLARGTLFLAAFHCPAGFPLLASPPALPPKPPLLGPFFRPRRSAAAGPSKHRAGGVVPQAPICPPRSPSLPFPASSLGPPSRCLRGPAPPRLSPWRGPGPP